MFRGPVLEAADRNIANELNHQIASLITDIRLTDRKSDAGMMILGQIEIHLVDTGMAWTASNCVDDLSDRHNVTLKQKFHASIGKVARVSANSISLGTATYKITITNALHSTAHRSLNTVHLA